MTNHYASWDDAVRVGNVTSEADGLPDTAMVPLVQAIREHTSLVTLQSCQGHPGNDGHLWLLSRTVPLRLERTLVQQEDPFWLVRQTYWPQGRLELWWHPDRRDEAVAALRSLLLPPEAAS